MSDKDYSFGRATFHFLHTDGPRGFLLRFVLTYAAVSFILQGISFWLQGPVYEIYLRGCLENRCDFMPYLDEINAASMRSNLATLMILPLTLGIWVIFEAASQRRYIRSEGFRLALGADEGRLAIVALIWAALLIAGYFAIVLGAVIPGLIIGLVLGAEAGAIVGLLAFLAGLGIGLWLFARLSAASALTVRDEQIRFFESWNLTKGHGGGLTLSYILLLLIFMVIMILGYAASFLFALALLSPVLAESTGNSDAISEAIRQPGFWMPLSLSFLPVLGLMSLMAHAFGGPAAWIVRQQTARGGTAISDTFS